MADFNESAPLSSVIDYVQNGLGDTAISVSSGIAEIITPLAALGFSIYLMLIAVSYMRGAASQPVWDVFIRAVGFSVIIGLGMNMENYARFVIPTVIQSGNEIAASASGSEDTTKTALDELAIHYIGIIEKDYDNIQTLMRFVGEAGNIMAPVLWAVECFIICIGLIPFLVFAAGLLLIAKVGVILIAAVGPLFFACLIFPATRPYFSAWLNAAVSYALIPIFMAVIAMLAINFSRSMLSDGSSLSESSFTMVFFASIVNLLFVVLFKMCASLAFSLSAGGLRTGFASGNAGGSGGGFSIFRHSHSGAPSGQREERAARRISTAELRLAQSNVKPG